MSNVTRKSVNKELNADFGNYLKNCVPRLLTQLDRDPHSPTFGCFDRDFWHYKMRDFSSIVLQQGMVVLQTLYVTPGTQYFRKPELNSWVDAAISFWVTQQLPSGGFNEYYPREDGFPPAAFSLYAVALVFKERGFPPPDSATLAAIQRTVDRLLIAPERSALNQEASALAAIVLAVNIPGITVEQSRLDNRLNVFFDRQSPEGWFPEYGGADIGYLSVTLDALFDYLEISGDVRAESAMQKALTFISSMISVSGKTPVMTNSRNTDYLAPYGLIRMAAKCPLAKSVVTRIFAISGKGEHFLKATDDRYLCHYLYQSCFRGLTHLTAMTAETVMLPLEKGDVIFFPEAGLQIQHIPGVRSIYTAARKGGVFYLYTPEGLSFADYGWRQQLGKGKCALTHWQNPGNSCKLSREDSELLVEASGRVSVHGWIISSPLRHLVLRCASLLLGRKIITWLKQVMIFTTADSGINYSRSVRITNDGVIIVDRFSGKGIDSFNPVPAPPYSLRHVASAANFSYEELACEDGASRVRKKTNEALTITTSFYFKETAR